MGVKSLAYSFHTAECGYKKLTAASVGICTGNNSTHTHTLFLSKIGTEQINDRRGESESEGRLNVTHEGWEGEEIKKKWDGSLEEQNTVETILKRGPNPKMIIFIWWNANVMHSSTRFQDNGKLEWNFNLANYEPKMLHFYFPPNFVVLQKKLSQTKDQDILKMIYNTLGIRKAHCLYPSSGVSCLTTW